MYYFCNFIKPTAPTQPPGNIRVTRFTADELRINWDAPPCGSRGGPVSYTFELLRVSPGTKPEPLVQNTVNTWIQIKPPAGYDHYIFKVATVNSAGMKYSEYINISPEVEDPTESIGIFAHFFSLFSCQK